MPNNLGIPDSALQYWGAIRGSVVGRGSTADVWAAISAQASSLGYDTPGISLQDFNALRSRAVSVRTAGENLSAGNPGSVLDGSMIALAPYARSLAEQNTGGMWQVEFTHTFNLDGRPVVAPRAVMFKGQLPQTPAELAELVDQDAQALADKYNTEHVSSSIIGILAV